MLSLNVWWLLAIPSYLRVGKLCVQVGADGLLGFTVRDQVPFLLAYPLVILMCNQVSNDF